MVKCADCGFLTYRNLDRITFLEVDEEYLKTGRSLVHLHEDARYMPICFAGRLDFMEEIARQGVASGMGELESFQRSLRPTTNMFPPLFAEERVCDEGFKQRIRGFTPKEHREMMDREAMLKLQHDWHASDLAAQTDIARIAKETATIQAASVKTQIGGLRLAIIAFVISSALAVAGMVINSRDDGTTNNYYAAAQPTAVAPQ